MTGHFGRTLDALHYRIAQQYAALGVDRSNNPVYGLEHGLQTAETKEMFEAVGTAIRQFGISRSWWQNRSLPLLAAATEVGYGYRGTGTDFWPRLEQRFGATISPNDRSTMSSLFEDAHRVFGIKQPIVSAWTKAFRHIAWPIANAIVPKELHRPLAAALREAMLVSSSLQPDDELARQLARAAYRSNSGRFVEWVVDSELAKAMLYHMLEIPDPASRLSGPAIIRILDDLGKDEEAASNVKQAIGIHRATRPGPDKTPVRTSLATLVLRFAKTGETELFLKMPPIPENLKSGIMEALVTEGLRPWLWESAGPFRPDHLLSGMELPIGDANLADAVHCSKPFLMFDDEKEIRHPVLALLAGMGPVLSASLLFRSRENGTVLELSNAREISEGDIVHVLAIDELADFDGMLPCGRVGGFFHYSLNLANAGARDWLTGQGWQQENPVLARLAGGLVISRDIGSPVFSAQMPVLVVPADHKGRSESAQIRIQSLDVPLGSLVLANPPTGSHVLEATSKGVMNQLRFQVADPPRAPDTLMMLCEPAVPSMDDLVKRQLSLCFRVPFPTAELKISVSLSSASGELAKVSGTIAELPCTLGSSDRLFAELAEKLDDAILPREGSFNLTVKVGKNWVQSWRLAWQATAVSWDLVNGTWSALADGEQLEVETRLASAPMVPLSASDTENSGSEFRLMIPLMGGRPQAADTLCIGPEVTTLDNFKIELPRLWLREAASLGQSAGLDDSLDAYLMWKLARPESLLSFMNARKVAAGLETLIVKILCGEFWLKKENGSKFLSGDGWTAFASTAIALGLATGDNLPEIDPGNRWKFARQLAGRMRDTAACPWDATLASDAEEFAERMDGAVVVAHEEFAQSRQLNDGNEQSDFDTYNPPERWQDALAKAHKGIRNEFLTGFLLPADRSQRLLVADYSMLLPNELALLIDRSHTDLARRNSPRWLSSDDLRLALELWINPRKLLATPDWRSSIHRLLDDRQTARAVRYAALRFRAAQGTFQDGVA